MSRVRYSNIYLLATVVSGLSSFHDALAIRVIDCLLEDIRVGMLENNPSNQQIRVMQMKVRAT